MSVTYRTKDAKIRAAYSWLKATGYLSGPKQSLSAFRVERKKVIDNRRETEAQFIRQQILHIVAASGIPPSKALPQKVGATHVFAVRWPIPPQRDYDYSFVRPELKALHKRLNALHFGLLLGYFYTEADVGLHFIGKLFHMETVEESLESVLREPNGQNVLWMHEDTAQAWLADAWVGIDAKSKSEVTYLATVDDPNLVEPHWKPVMKAANDVMMKHHFRYHILDFNCNTFVAELAYKLTGKELVADDRPEVKKTKAAESSTLDTTMVSRISRSRGKTSRFSPYTIFK